MAKKKTVPSQDSFEQAILSISYRFPLQQVFEDFLTMGICAFSQNLTTQQSYYEDEYLSTVSKYKDSPLRHEFPQAFARLIVEMEERLQDSGRGVDVLGDFYEQHISNGRNRQFFTPNPICEFMSSITIGDAEQTRPLRILDPACGSGRMLLAAYRNSKYRNEYYGIDIDRICVKMTAINLFLTGAFNSEVMCANALVPGDFVIAYKISLFPFGIFKVEQREESKLWHMYKNSFEQVQPKEKLSDKIVLNTTPFNERKKDDGSQLFLF